MKHVFKGVVTQEIMLSNSSASVETLEDSPYSYAWNIKLDFYSENFEEEEIEFFNRTENSKIK